MKVLKTGKMLSPMTFIFISSAGVDDAMVISVITPIHQETKSDEL